AGVRGVLSRGSGGERLAAALAALVQGLVVQDSAFAEAARPRTTPRPSLAEDLTPRERQVLGLLSEGLSNPQIALRLGVAERTAVSHVTSIRGRLGAEGGREPVVVAGRWGLIALCRPAPGRPAFGDGATACPSGRCGGLRESDSVERDDKRADDRP